MTTDRIETIDRYLSAEIEKQRIPGLTLALSWNGELRYARGYGLANAEVKAPAGVETVYQIGSITKQFTVAAFMILVGQGKADLNQSVGRYLGGWPEKWSGITLYQLLTHTSGLKDMLSLPGFSYRKDFSREELLEILKESDLEFSPGEKWKYSNTGYILIGWMIEELSGRSYEDFLRAAFFEPLGMSRTRLLRNGELVENRASGYVCEKDCWSNGVDHRPDAIAGAGGLLSTALDLARWDAALRRRTPPLSPALLDAVWTPAHLKDGTLARTNVSCGETYGFGWFLGEWKGRPIVSHTGETDAGFSTEIYRLQDDGWTVILLSNVKGIDQDKLTKEVLKRMDLDKD